MPPGTAAQPLRAVVGEVRIDAPAIRVTRTKDGIVLPVRAAAAGEPGAGIAAHRRRRAAASPAPAPGAGAGGQVAALRISDGALDFTDRAVKPAVADPLRADRDRRAQHRATRIRR